MFVTGMGDLNALAGVQNAINVQCNSTARQTKGSDRECCLIFKLPVDLVKMCAIKLAWPCKLVINQARIPPYLPGFGAIDNFMSIFFCYCCLEGVPRNVHRDFFAMPHPLLFSHSFIAPTVRLVR